MSTGKINEEVIYDEETGFPVDFKERVAAYVKKNPIDKCPLFASSTDELMESNPEAVEALQALKYGDTPDENAVESKNEGNRFLKQGDYDGYMEAVLCYSEGIAHEQKVKDKEVITQLYNNRSQAHLSLKNYGKAMADCKKVLEREPKNIKAIYRYAKAAVASDKCKLALKYSRLGQKCLKESMEGLTDEKQIKQKETMINMFVQFEGKANHRLEFKRKQKQKEIIEVQRAKQKQRLQLQYITEADKKLLYKKYPNITLGTLCEYDTTKYVPGAYLHLSRVQHVKENDTFNFQVLFQYEELDVTDFVQQMNTTHTVLDHLSVMMPSKTNGGEPFPYARSEPERDRYVYENMQAYFFDFNTVKTHPTLVSFDISEISLHEILNHPKFIIPSNLILMFHIIPADSPTLKDWKIVPFSKRV